MAEILGVVETGIYVDDLDATEAFYAGLLGLPIIEKEPTRHIFFRVGESSVLLAFLSDVSLKGDTLPSHGSRGPGHFALGIPVEDYSHWLHLLTENRVRIEQEVQWSRGGLSMYFRDPAGNLVELLTHGGLWGLASGW